MYYIIRFEWNDGPWHSKDQITLFMKPHLIKNRSIFLASEGYQERTNKSVTPKISNKFT